MNKFYKVFLNSAKTHTYNSWGHYHTGGIEAFPAHFDHNDPYSGYGYVFAEKVGNNFEEIIFGKTIYLDENGIKDTHDLFKLDVEVLLNELKKPLSCYSYSEVNKIEVAGFIKSISSDDNMLKKYYEELEFVENKVIVNKEITRRREETLLKNKQDSEADKIITEFMRSRKLKR